MNDGTEETIEYMTEEEIITEGRKIGKWQKELYARFGEELKPILTRISIEEVLTVRQAFYEVLQERDNLKAENAALRERVARLEVREAELIALLANDEEAYEKALDAKRALEVRESGEG